MTNAMRPALSLLAAAALVACGNAKPASPPQAAAPPQMSAQAASHDPPKAVSSNVALDADILRACKIEFSNTTDAPKFDFDSTELMPDDLRVLGQVAACLTTGPLKGRSVELIGRADPRGTTEYNMALGGRRAHQVTDYLQQHGVSARLRETSRGALDATGHDESGWRADRRVDLVLGS